MNKRALGILYFLCIIFGVWILASWFSVNRIEKKLSTRSVESLAQAFPYDVRSADSARASRADIQLAMEGRQPVLTGELLPPADVNDPQAWLNEQKDAIGKHLEKVDDTWKWDLRTADLSGLRLATVAEETPASKPAAPTKTASEATTKPGTSDAIIQTPEPVTSKVASAPGTGPVTPARIDTGPVLPAGTPATASSPPVKSTGPSTTIITPPARVATTPNPTPTKTPVPPAKTTAAVAPNPSTITSPKTIVPPAGTTASATPKRPTVPPAKSVTAAKSTAAATTPSAPPAKVVMTPGKVVPPTKLSVPPVTQSVPVPGGPTKAPTTVSTPNPAVTPTPTLPRTGNPVKVAPTVPPKIVVKDRPAATPAPSSKPTSTTPTLPPGTVVKTDPVSPPTVAKVANPSPIAPKTTIKTTPAVTSPENILPPNVAPPSTVITPKPIPPAKTAVTPVPTKTAPPPAPTLTPRTPPATAAVTPAGSKPFLRIETTADKWIVNGEVPNEEARQRILATLRYRKPAQFEVENNLQVVPGLDEPLWLSVYPTLAAAAQTGSQNPYVNVENGVAVLHGTAESEAAKALAGQRVKSRLASANLKLVNQITVGSDVSTTRLSTRPTVNPRPPTPVTQLTPPRTTPPAPRPTVTSPVKSNPTAFKPVPRPPAGVQKPLRSVRTAPGRPVSTKVSSPDTKAVSSKPNKAITEADVVKALNAMTIQFGADGTTIRPSDTAKLDRIAVLLQQQPRLKIAAHGYSESGEDTTTKEIESIQRAKTVRSYLEKKGVPYSRISIKGSGSQNPIGDNNTTSGRQQNRRVEFDIQ